MSIYDTNVGGLQQAYGQKDVTSRAMALAIRDWFDLYFIHASEHAAPEEDPAMRLPVATVNKLYKAIFGEYKASIGTDTAQGKAGFYATCLAALDAVRKEAAQQMLIGGSCLLKPVPVKGGFLFHVVRRDRFVPFGRDASGRLNAVGMMEQTVQGDTLYTLMERRSLDGSGRLTIENKLFASRQAGDFGSQVPLATLDKYADLLPAATLPVPLCNLGMVELRTPMENVVDGTDDAVSVYAAATDLIHRINRNEWQLGVEFDNGTSRIIVSADMLETSTTGADGQRRPKRLRDTVFTALDEDPDTVGVTIFSPELRHQSFFERKQEYLRGIENVIGLKRGILSSVEAEERTATQITDSAGDYNLTITDFQSAWSAAVTELLLTCDTLGQMYNLCDSSAFDLAGNLSIDWGDGVLYDRKAVGAEMLDQVAAGLLQPERYLGWYYGLPADTPEARAKIRQDYMPATLAEGGA